MSMRRGWIGLLSLLLAAGMSLAQPGELELLDSWPVGGRALAVDGSRAVTMGYDDNWMPVLRSFTLPAPGEEPVVGTLELPGGGFDVLIHGDIAYLAGGSAGLRVVDISDLLNPSFVRTLPLPGEAISIARLDPQTLRIALAYSGYARIDISDPLNPAALAFQPTFFGEANGVLASGGTASVEQDSLKLWDDGEETAAIRYAPGVSGFDARAQHADLSQDGGLLACAWSRRQTTGWDTRYSGGLSLLDVNGNEPLLLWHDWVAGFLPGEAHAVELAGNWVLAAWDDLKLYDISNPTAPVLEDIWDDSVYDLAQVDGGRVLAISETTLTLYQLPGDATAGSGISSRRYPLSSPPGPGRHRTQQALPPRQQDAKRQPPPARPGSDLDEVSFTEIASLDGFTSINTLASPGNTLYAGDDTGLHVYDVIDPAAPTWLTTVLPGEELRDMLELPDENGDPAVLWITLEGEEFAEGSAVLLDVSDPRNPVELAIDLPDSVYSLTVGGNRLFMSGYETVYVYDITDPFQPLLLTDAMGFPGGVNACDGEWMVTLESHYHPMHPDSYTWRIYDLTSFTLPWAVKGGYAGDTAVATALHDNHLYLSNYDGTGNTTLTTVSLAEPFAPVTVSTLGLDVEGSLARPVAFAADTLLLTAGQCKAISLADPGNPVVDGGIDGSVRELSESWPYVFTSDNQDVVHIYEAAPGTAVRDGGGEASRPESFALKPVHPNPFNAAATVTVTLPAAGELTVELIDITGRRVAELAGGRMHAGEHRFTLDGSRLASGVYFVRAALDGGAVQTRKAVLLR